MKEVRNKLIFAICLNLIKAFEQRIYDEISENDEIIIIAAIIAGKLLNNGAKNYLYMLIYYIIFIIIPKFPKCFLEILVNINFFLLISPKHLGNFGQ